MTKQQIIKSKILTPGLIDGKTVHFLATSGNLYFMKPDGQEGYNKDTKGQYVKIPKDEVIEARLQYLDSYGAQEKEHAILDELLRLQTDLEKRAQDYILIITNHEKFISDIDCDGDSLLDILARYFPEFKETSKKESDSFFQSFPDAAKFRDALKTALLAKDYELLYQLIDFKYGKPLASFKNGPDVDFTAIKNIIGRDNIEQTINDLKDKGTLYLQAKIKVEKQYAPE